MARRQTRHRRYNISVMPIDTKHPTQSIIGLANRLMAIMATHIGQAKKITKAKLFKMLFHEEMDFANNLNHLTYWSFAAGAMHYCRLYSNCFIVPIKESPDANGNDCSYCVADKEADIEDYIEILAKNIKAMRQCQYRAQQAIEEKWSKQEWRFNTDRQLSE